jgi:hypothetical protein
MVDSFGFALPTGRSTGRFAGGSSLSPLRLGDSLFFRILQDFEPWSISKTARCFLLSLSRFIDISANVGFPE